MVKEAGATRIVTINVGGSLFQSTNNTLGKADRGSLFDVILNAAGDNQSSKDWNDQVLMGGDEFECFVDRDPTHFRRILNYLRDGETSIENLSTTELTEISQECAFYRLSKLKCIVDIKLHQSSGKQKSTGSLRLRKAKSARGLEPCSKPMTRSSSFRKAKSSYDKLGDSGRSHTINIEGDTLLPKRNRINCIGTLMGPMVKYFAKCLDNTPGVTVNDWANFLNLLNLLNFMNLLNVIALFI